ncbi:hypothetical protein SEA_SATIS_257 [Streptomyces phage Satis]|nr:hypothetical protein SEA_SATIS_257 [Streptomyces phage Satis]QBZ72144.1 hypothetical protein SEA_KRADAL_258 [Streptomyces phage Kradal]QPL14565.1 hypothetical protein SEA_EHYELIMAYOE_260 [Streptomyces phage EhyElimayoE]
MANQLVVFPRDDSKWEKVDGSGMYVLTVLPRESVEDPCAVGAGITLLRPQSDLLLPAGQFWSSRETLEDDEKLFEQAGSLFDEKGEHAKATLMKAQLPASTLSVEMVAAVRLGASVGTWKSKETGEHWHARWEDLTPSGILLLHQLHTCFMRAPLILTFLGDGDAK